MTEKKKIDIQAFLKFHLIMGLLAGLLAGIVYAFGGLVIDALVSLNWITCTETPGLSYGTVLAFGALIGMPAIGAVLGLVLGIVELLLFTLFRGWLGWLDLNFERKD